MNYWIRYIIYRNRYRLARFYQTALFCFLAALFLFLLFQIPFSAIMSKYFKPINFSLFSLAAGWGERDPAGLIRSAAPVFAWAGSGEDYPEEITPRSLLSALLSPFEIKIGNPRELLTSEMQVLAEYNKAMTAAAGSVQDEAIKDERMEETKKIISDEALIGIYFTHTGETYAMTDGVERISGKGGVVQAGKALKEKLENDYGIRVAFSDSVNDSNYGVSYVESEKTARVLLEEHKNIKILLDIHRDAGKSRSESLVRINGKEIAPILIIVGSDARSPFPGWRNNYHFALRLAEKINDKYPGLCLGVSVKEGRYNQFLHPRALLLEIGTVNNSTAEAVESVELLAEFLASEALDPSLD